METIISLDSSWKVKYFDPGMGEKEHAYEEQYADEKWMDLEVPNDVRVALLKYGIINDPYKDKNIERQYWIEEKEWWFRKKFIVTRSQANGYRVKLMFNGLDGVCKIWLNGKELGVHKNMFRPFIKDITDLLHIDSENVLVVKFEPIKK